MQFVKWKLTHGKEEWLYFIEFNKNTLLNLPFNYEWNVVIQINVMKKSLRAFASQIKSKDILKEID